MNIHDRYVSNFRRIRKDEKYLFLYNEVEQDFVDFFFSFFFNDLLLYMRVWRREWRIYNLIWFI